MEITRGPQGGDLLLILKGRLDSYWAEHLSAELDKGIHDGFDRITLDFSSVEFISSPGIGVLLKYYKRLQGVHGSLRVINPTALVKSVMDLSGLTRFLITEIAPDEYKEQVSTPPRTITTDRLLCEIFTLVSGASVQCTSSGVPITGTGPMYDAEMMKTIKFTDSMFGIGLGALGKDFSDCRNRFGDFLAVSGNAGYLPTDGSTIPDYLTSKGTYRPEVQVLYGLTFQGPFSHLLRFESATRHPVILSELFTQAFDAVDSPSIGLVIIAETTGLIGTSLRKSPVISGDEDMFEYPGIRKLFTFTSDPAYSGSIAVATGIISRDPAPELQPFLRKRNGVSEHIHAMTFPFQPIIKGKISCRDTIDSLFSAASPLGLFHLLNDDRPIRGRGESGFVKGAVWISPVQEAAASEDAG